MIQAIKKIVDKQDLTFDGAYQVMSEIMNGKPPIKCSLFNFVHQKQSQ